jgi:type VI secretion system secreted protein VgrG
MISLFGDALPSDALVHGYDAQEGISQPYAVEVELSTEDTSFVADACLRTRMLLATTSARGAARHFDGIVDEIRFASFSAGRLHFRARLRPAIAALEHREGCRIFQAKSPVDVIKQILADAGVDENVKWQLGESYPAREFIVQYRETELNFVHRLLEDEGIFYFFRHAEDGHTLIFADAPSAFEDEAGGPPLRLAAAKGVGPLAEPVLDLTRTSSLRATSVRLRDYDFERPQRKPEAEIPAKGAWPMPYYAYPGGFTDEAGGAARARATMKERRRDADVYRGRSPAVGLSCGAKVSVEGAAEPWMNGELVVSELRTVGQQKVDAGEMNHACESTFAAIPAGVPFAPPRRAHRPRIRGVQQAVVTGPTSEEQGVHVDRYGRVKVRFFWDRSGKQDDTSSCWLRVSQVALGGSMALPRVGWELSVAFMDGDPDRPLALGRAYNAEKAPPYGLPAAAATTALKSMSSPGGAGHNEIKMGDSAGGQGLGISAQKDLNTTIGNDKVETVAADETHSVGSNLQVSIGSNEETTVGADQSVNVGNALQTKITGNQTLLVGGNEKVSSKADFVEHVKGSRFYTVAGNQTTISNGVRQEIKGAFTRSVGQVQVTAALGRISDDMLSTYDESAGAFIAELAAGVSSEEVTGAKDLTSSAGELHMVESLTTSAASVSQLIGGVHYRKVGGDYYVTAPKILLGGGIGTFKGGGSSIKLSGGPVVLKGSKIAIVAGAVVKLGGSLKLG